MPATSGSPTQIATSQPTKAALSNTPADQFQSGDLGYVQEELTAARCPLFALVQSGGPAVDGLLVLSVYQNAAARWVSLTLAASGMIEVANAAALATVPTSTLPLGALAWIDTYRTWARLDSTTNAGALVADEVFAADVGTRRWVRVETPVRSWATQTAWEVNTTTGNNENSGAPGFPLLSLQEYFRRVPVVSAVDTLVTCTGPVVLVGTQQSDESTLGVRRVKIKGATATLASGPVAAINAPNIAGNAPANLSVTGIADWTPYLQGIVETTLPSNDLAWAVVGRQPVAPVADTGPWATVAVSAQFGYFPSGTSAAPIVGATVRVLSFLASASGLDLQLRGDKGIAYAVETMDLRTASAWAFFAQALSVNGCLLRDGGPSGTRNAFGGMFLVATSWQGTVAQTLFPSGLMSWYGATFFRTASITAQSLINLAGATFFGAGFAIGNTVSGIGPMVAANTLNGGGGCTGIGVHGAAVQASVNPRADGITIRGGARLNITGNNAYGVQAVAGSVGIRAWGEGQVSYYAGNPPITGAAGDWSLGETNPATGIMPPIYAAGAWPATIALPSTWATLGAASPGGFSGFAFYAGSFIANAK